MMDLATALAAEDQTPPGPFYLAARMADRDIRVGADAHGRWWYLVGLRAEGYDPDAPPRYTFTQTSGPFATPGEAAAAGRRAPIGPALFDQERAALAAYGGR